MSIKPICDKCKRELTGFGGILFGPPDEKGMTRKWHLCVSCYGEIISEFKK